MMRKSVLLLTLLVIVAGLLTMACETPAHCSPGFWKNKGYKIYGPYDTTDLYAKGPGSAEIRLAAAAELNAIFTDADMYCK